MDQFIVEDANFLPHNNLDPIQFGSFIYFLEDCEFIKENKWWENLPSGYHTKGDVKCPPQKLFTSTSKDAIRMIGLEENDNLFDIEYVNEKSCMVLRTWVSSVHVLKEYLGGGRKMKYEEFVELYDYFQPVVNITDERENYWKQFIPTKDFLHVLGRFIEALQSKDPKDRKSIWLQGAYGTGKSHATTVIKHLLWDPVNEIEDFIEKLEAQTREKLRNFRKENKVLPVVLEGISGITDPKTLSLTLEKAVKEALKRENITVQTQSEFEKYIVHIKNTPYINYDIIVQRNMELRSRVRNKDGLLNALTRRNTEVLRILEKSLDFSISHPNIADWLVEISKELSEQDIYAMAIYWDEFTSLMNLENVPTIMSVLQDIAEKTTNNNVFLFIISHRTPQQATNSDYKKLLGRFHQLDYNMENIATFQILSNAIRKIDEERWRTVQEEAFDKNSNMNRLISKIVTDDITSKNQLKSLFPIHPYTAAIATYMSRYVGSAQRSIFSFLYDRESGFLRFIRDYPQESDSKMDYFLTADKLWDFFLPDFKNSYSEKTSSIVSKYYQLESIFEDLGTSYLSVLKGILLLNISNSLIKTPEEGNTLYLPSTENIMNMFIGTSFEELVPTILEHIDKKGYITKNPDGLFLVSYSVLPEKEVSEEKKDLMKEYENITKLLDSTHKENIYKVLSSPVLREVKIQIYPAKIKDYELKRRLETDFSSSYYIPVALFLAKEESEIQEVRDVIDSLHESGSINLANIVFAISHTPLTSENYEKFAEYIARVRVAERHQFKDEEKDYREYSIKLVDQWIGRVVNGTFEICFKRSCKQIAGTSFAIHLSEEISPKIFWSGLENIRDLTNNNVWKHSASEKAAEVFASSQNRDDLEQRTKNAPLKDLRAILMDASGNYIVDKTMNFIQNVDLNHPTYKICTEVKKTIEKYSGKGFNLGDELAFLQKPPYGIYKNMIGYATLAFALRPFIGKIYEQGTGRKITDDLLKDKLTSLFKYWEEGKDRDKLEMRLGTEYERRLTNLLVKLFNMTQEENLNNACWKIREWVKRSGYPLWALKYFVENDNGNEINTCIDTLLLLSRSGNREFSEDSLKSFASLFSLKSDELSVLITQQNLEAGFKKWIEQKMGVSLSDDEFKEIAGYLRNNMQEEVGLWTEEKVEVVLNYWKIDASKKKAERDFIGLMNKIFSLEHIDDLIELKRQVRSKINDLELPLWSLKYVFNVDDMRKALDDIDKFVRDFPMNFETMDEFARDIRLYVTNIQINLNRDMAKQGFGTFMKEKYPNYSTNLNLDDFLRYVHKRIAKEIYSWEEEDFERLLIEYDSCKKLGECFEINGVLGPYELRENIKRHIERLPYPLWLLEFNENGKEIFNGLNKFLNSSSLPSLNEMEEISNGFSKEMVAELLNDDSLHNQFIVWLNQVLSEHFKLKSPLGNDTLDGIADDIKRKLTIHDFHWNMYAVKDAINNGDWNDRIFKNIKEDIKQKIESSKKDLREILLTIIEEYPEICVKLEEYLE